MIKTRAEKKTLTPPPNPILRAFRIEITLVLVLTALLVAVAFALGIIQTGKSDPAETFKTILSHMYSVGEHWNGFCDDVAIVDTAAATVLITFALHAIKNSDRIWENPRYRKYLNLPVFAPLFIMIMIVLPHVFAISAAIYSKDSELLSHIISHSILILLFLFMGTFIAYLLLPPTEALIKNHETSIRKNEITIDTINEKTKKDNNKGEKKNKLCEKIPCHIAAGIIWALAWLYILLWKVVKHSFQTWTFPSWKEIEISLLCLAIYLIIALYSDIYAITRDKSLPSSFLIRSIPFLFYVILIVDYLEGMPSKLSHYPITKAILLPAFLYAPFLLSILVSKEVPVKGKRWYKKLYWYIHVYALRPLSIRGLSEFCYTTYLRFDNWIRELSSKSLEKHIADYWRGIRRTPDRYSSRSVFHSYRPKTRRKRR